MYTIRQLVGNIRCHLPVHQHTHVPDEEKLNACREAFNTRGVLDPPTEDKINLMKLVLKRNNFTLNDIHFLQKQGIAMGTRMAPFYINLFMDKLEMDLLQWAK